MASNRTLGCLIANFRPVGNFMLTTQRLAAAHTDESGIIFPIDPQTNDLHLVDFDGDGYWVMYKFDGSTWVLVAEIESTSIPNNNISEFYVNTDSQPLISQPENISKPFTTVLDAVTALTNSSMDLSLDSLFETSFPYSYLPNADTVFINGDNYMLTELELADIVALNKRFRLVIDSYLYMFITSSNLGNISQDILDIRGEGSIYAAGASQALLTAGPGLRAINMDLASVYWGGIGDSSIFDLSHSEARVDIKLNNLFANNTNDYFWLANEDNQGCNIDINSVVLITTSVIEPSSSSGLLVPMSILPGTADFGRKYTNVNIGSISSLEGDSPLAIFRTRIDTASQYTNQTLNVSIRTIEGLNPSSSSTSVVPLLESRGLISIVNSTGSAKTFLDSRLNFNFDTITGDSTLLSIVVNFDGDLNINTNKKFAGTDPTIPLVELFRTDLDGRVSIKGIYDSHIRLMYNSALVNYEVNNFYLEGTYTLQDIGTFFRLTNDHADNEFTFILNNCKIIGDTSSSLVGLVSGVAPAVFNLICSNVTTNMMGLLPAWVTVEGSLTQNINFK